MIWPTKFGILREAFISYVSRGGSEVIRADKAEEIVNRLFEEAMQNAQESKT